MSQINSFNRKLERAVHPDEAVLKVEHVSKSFGPVQALIDGCVELFPGEAHALLGENGAGKSTLVKMLAGIYDVDAGQILHNGVPIEITSPLAARAAGIAVIYQEPTLFPDLSVAENIFMGRQPLSPGRRINKSEMNRRTKEVFDRLGVNIAATRKARGLSVADQQIVEIAKAISFESKIIIMDEPTAALTDVEVARLFDVIKTLRAEGAAILFISHRLEEVFAMCQRVTIMRDGKFVKTSSVDQITLDEIIFSMIGRDIVSVYSRHNSEPGELLLEVKGLTRAGVFKDINFSVRAGEIVALAGLVGAGRTEVARGIFGIDPVDSGVAIFKGKKLQSGSPLSAMNAGIGFVPEDRRQQGLVMDMAIDRNIALASLNTLRRGGLIRGGSERSLASKWTSQLQVKFGSFSNSVKTLSGGNQQKVVLAKWLARTPSLLIIDEPTRGIDIGTKSEVHKLLSELVSQGVGILMISSEMPEVLGVADRILVIHEGRLAAEFSRDEASEALIMRAATGQESVVA